MKRVDEIHGMIMARGDAVVMKALNILLSAAGYTIEEVLDYGEEYICTI